MKRALLAIFMAATLGSPAWAVSNPAEMMADPAQERRAEALGQQLRCLVCQNESIEDSEADLARDLRGVLRQHIAAGDTDPQIMAWMTQRYGDFVRLSPPLNALTLALWGAPVLALGAGIGAAVLTRRRRMATQAAALSADEQQRLSALLDR
jgi:cytochrome c-type biogenesis protein CcmH